MDEYGMQAGIGTIDASPSAGAPEKRGGKVRLLTLSDLDGRTRAAQYARDTQAAICSDLGGEARLSTLQRMAVESVTLTAAMLRDLHARYLQGDDVEVATVATLSNTFNRTAGALGWERTARDVSADIEHWAAGKAAEKERAGSQPVRPAGAAPLDVDAHAAEGVSAPATSDGDADG
jgi:hypothetical protein